MFSSIIIIYFMILCELYQQTSTDFSFDSCVLELSCTESSKEFTKL